MCPRESVGYFSRIKIGCAGVPSGATNGLAASDPASQLDASAKVDLSPASRAPLGAVRGCRPKPQPLTSVWPNGTKLSPPDPGPRVMAPIPHFPRPLLDALVPRTFLSPSRARPELLRRGFGARYGWRRVRVRSGETAGSGPFHRCSNALAGSGALSCPLYAHPLTLLGSPAASGALPRAAPARSQCRGAGQRARSHAAGGPCPPPARWLQPQPASPSAKHLGPFAAALSVRLHEAFPRHFRAGRGTHRPLTSRRDGARAAQ